jgi:hypothetical protein
MSSTERKQKSIKKNIKSASKKPSRSSKTSSCLSRQTTTTARKKKDLLQLGTQKNIDAFLSSSATSKTSGEKPSELSLHDVLINVKKRSTKETKEGKSGFIPLTEKEQGIISKIKFENAMGRPLKKEEEKLQVESIRFYVLEKNILITAAKEKGFLSWKKYVKYVALENAKKSA